MSVCTLTMQIVCNNLLPHLCLYVCVCVCVSTSACIVACPFAPSVCLFVSVHVCVCLCMCWYLHVAGRGAPPVSCVTPLLSVCHVCPHHQHETAAFCHGLDYTYTRAQCTRISHHCGIGRCKTVKLEKICAHT